MLEDVDRSRVADLECEARARRTVVIGRFGIGSDARAGEERRDAGRRPAAALLRPRLRGGDRASTGCGGGPRTGCETGGVMDEGVVDRLRALGMSLYEARIYVGLLRHGPQNGNEVSKSAGIPSSKVYSTLERLVVERDRPLRARPAPATQYICISPDELIHRLPGRVRRADRLPREGAAAAGRVRARGGGADRLRPRRDPREQPLHRRRRARRRSTSRSGPTTSSTCATRSSPRTSAGSGSSGCSTATSRRTPAPGSPQLPADRHRPDRAAAC